MKKQLLFLSVSGLIVFSLHAQTFNMPQGNTASATYTTCSGNFYDNGGSGSNYNNNQFSSITFLPSTAGQYISVTFTSFNTENGWDYLYVFDGPAGPLVTSYTGTPATPFTITASSSSTTGGLTFIFSSDGSGRRAGWTATVSCTSSPASPPSFTPNSQDCQQGGGTTICSNTTFNGNSSGGGNVNDLQSSWDGCLSGENQSSWYYFSPSSAGTIGFSITPSNGTDDYDFAVWGPFNYVTCPMNALQSPLRCSWAAGGGSTGCGNGATDNSEGAGGDKWVSTFNVNAGEVYVMVIDNYTSSSSPFTLSWSLTNGSSLNCTVLPIELVNFTGALHDKQVHLDWQTSSENNNDYFTIERSANGLPYEAIGRVEGSGNSTQLHAYAFEDLHPAEGVNYYRLKQTDYNGVSTYAMQMAVISYHVEDTYVENIRPLPTTGDFRFDFATPEATTIHYTITDMTGRIISENRSDMNAGRNTVNASIGDAVPGVYFLRVEDELHGGVYVKQLIKN